MNEIKTGTSKAAGCLLILMDALSGLSGGSVSLFLCKRRSVVSHFSLLDIERLSVGLTATSKQEL